MFEVGEVYETRAYKGHVYIVIGEANEGFHIRMLLLSTHPKLDVKPGQAFNMTRHSMEYALETGQIERLV